MDSKFVVFLIVAVSSIKISEQFIQPPRRKCPENYFPVCGTDGNTYDNYCYMKLERQTTKRNIRLAHRGPCEQKQCNKACPYIYSPVCGSNGKIYDNECLLKAEACESGIKLKIMKDSFCEQQKPKKCNKACPYIYFPVCASNGKIYDNECLLKAEACESGIKLKIMKDSFCEQQKPKKCNKACPYIYLPVCASNGKTYDNECLLKAEACEFGIELKIMKDSFCEQQKPKKCNKACPYTYFPVCASNGKIYDNECLLKAEACESGIKLKIMKDSFCVKNEPKKCFGGCPFIYLPVCASNGITYSNRCVMKYQACELGENLTVVKIGAC